MSGFLSFSRRKCGILLGGFFVRVLFSHVTNHHHHYLSELTILPLYNRRSDDGWLKDDEYFGFFPSQF